MLSNVAPMIFLHHQTISAHFRSIKEWETWKDSNFGRRFASKVLDLAGWKIPDRTTRDVQKALRYWLHRLALSPEGLLEGRFETLLSSAFVHLHPGHFLNNMCSLWTISDSCADIPGVDLTHVLTITIGSAISGSLACLVEMYLQNPWRFRTGGRRLLEEPTFGLGASAVVSAFMTMGVVALPDAACQVVNLPFLKVSVPARAVAIVQFGGDVVGLCMRYLSSTEGRRNAGGVQTGHLPHLAGAVFGYCYYVAYFGRPRDTTSAGKNNR
jgi:membrane associated rhomboid family serine protease